MSLRLLFYSTLKILIDSVKKYDIILLYLVEYFLHVISTVRSMPSIPREKKCSVNKNIDLVIMTAIAFGASAQFGKKLINQAMDRELVFRAITLKRSIIGKAA